jgi:hypothetical protein
MYKHFSSYIRFLGGIITTHMYTLQTFPSHGSLVYLNTTLVLTEVFNISSAVFKIWSLALLINQEETVKVIGA